MAQMSLQDNKRIDAARSVLEYDESMESFLTEPDDSETIDTDIDLDKLLLEPDDYELLLRFRQS